VIVIPYHVRYVTYRRAQGGLFDNLNGEYDSGFDHTFFLREGSARRFAEELKGKATFIPRKPKAPDVSTLLGVDRQSVWPLPL
jgi:hypothetical protein